MSDDQDAYDAGYAEAEAQAAWSADECRIALARAKQAEADLKAAREEGRGEGRAEVRNVCPGCGEPWRGPGMTMKPAGGCLSGERRGFWYHAACVEAIEQAEAALAEARAENARLMKIIDETMAILDRALAGGPR